MAGETRTEAGRILRFAVVGVANTGVDFSAFLLLAKLAGAPLALANAGGWALAVSVSYALNSVYTFRANGAARSLSAGGWARFALANAAGLAVSTGVVLALAPGLGAPPAKLIAIAAGFCANYLLVRRVFLSRR